MSTVVELRQKAKILGVKGYSKMNKEELEKAIQKATRVGVSHFERIENYNRQNGSQTLTARQVRRAQKKISRRGW